MIELVTLFLAVSLAGVLLLSILYPRISFIHIAWKMKHAISAPWSLSEFLKMKPNQSRLKKYYSFSEENVKSLGYRYLGRFDGGILHWEEVPILDLIIEYKFPASQLPKQARREDAFQSGLYALALLESGVSCSTTRLVTIYCLQDKAQRCFSKKSTTDCWQCDDGKAFVSRFKPKSVLKELKRLDEVWYNGRKPKPSRKADTCRACPYSSTSCNYSAA